MYILLNGVERRRELSKKYELKLAESGNDNWAGIRFRNDSIV